MGRAPGEAVFDLPARFRVDGELGRGGMGVVLDAMDTALGRRVAVKVVPRAGYSAADADRLLREARAGAALESPRATRIFEAGYLGTGEVYVVMERLTGETLEQRLERAGPLPVSVAVAFALEALDAVGEAHRRGLVHRDLKPANLFITRSADGHEHVKVLDFGLVRDTLAAGSLTESGEGLGTPAYMPPEQIRAAKDVDARADVWSFGATLYEMLTGRLPFEAPNIPAMLTRILVQPCTPLTSLRSDVPPALGAVVQRCLEKDPAARYGGGDELARALRDLVTVPLLPVSSSSVAAAHATLQAAPHAPGPRESGSLVFWRVLAVTLVVGAVVALVIGGAFAWTRGPRSTTTVDAVAPRERASAPPRASADAGAGERDASAAPIDASASRAPVAPPRTGAPASRPKVCSCRAPGGKLLCRDAFACTCQTSSGEQLFDTPRGTNAFFAQSKDPGCKGYPRPDRNGVTQDQKPGIRSCDRLACTPEKPPKVPGEDCRGRTFEGDQGVRGNVTCE